MGNGCEAQIKHIPQADPPGLSLVDFLAITAQPQQASTIISAVSKRFPLPASLSHLKRVRRPPDEACLEILVCTLTQGQSNSDEDVTANLSPEVRGFLQQNGWLDAAVRRSAPQYPAHTREEWKLWCHEWPSAWKPPPAISMDATGSLTPEEREMMTRCMREVCSAADAAGVSNAALIMKHDTGEKVALEVDAQASHPLHHAVMQALEAVANSHLATGNADETPDGEVEPHSKRMRRPDPVIDGPSGAGDVEQQSSGIRACDQPYLCKGYDCFVVHEPCVMCAMALTHSRVRRVLFAHKDASGALGGDFRLHGQAGLNHRLQVYQVQLPGS